MTDLLSINDLNLDITRPKNLQLLRGVSLTVRRGETVGLVGESGSGKSLTARAAIGLLPLNSGTTGHVLIDGFDVLNATPDAIRHLRRSKTSMVFQDPRSSLNPVRRIGDYLTEALLLEEKWTRAAVHARAVRLLAEVGLPDPTRHMHQFPHELSGGMLQRVMIAGALMIEPELLICDEPTSALDVLSQKDVIRILKAEQCSRDMGMLFTTHDLDLAGVVCDRICVMTGGLVVEEGTPGQVFENPQHPYTLSLLASQPRDLKLRRKIVAAGGALSAVLDVRSLRKTYSTRDGDFVAVEDISFSIRPGETLAIVGESGSGKSTTARIIVGLEEPDAGSIATGDTSDKTIAATATQRRLKRAKHAQIVFQDPYQSLDPRLTIFQAINAVLRLHGMRSIAERTARTQQLLEQVGLQSKHGDAQPWSLSGGQRQRAAIAKALAVDPAVLVLDEATSALDVSVQAQVMRLIDDIRAATGLAVIFVSHDLNLVSTIADYALVMRKGVVVEEGVPRELLRQPKHPYTRELVEAIPTSDWSLT